MTVYLTSEELIDLEHECMPDGPGGDTCWDPPHQSFEYDLEVPEPLPYFRRDGTSTGGDIPLRVTSAEGHLQPTELVAHATAPRNRKI